MRGAERDNGEGWSRIRGRGMLTRSKGEGCREGGRGRGEGRPGRLPIYLPVSTPDTAKATSRAINSSISEVYDDDSSV